jgi:hypothetical protein
MRICIGYRITGFDFSKFEEEITKAMEEGFNKNSFEELLEPRKLLFTRKYKNVLNFLEEKKVFIHTYKIEKVYDDATFEEVDISKFYYKVPVSQQEMIESMVFRVVDHELERYRQLGVFSPVFPHFLRFLGIPEDRNLDKVERNLEEFKKAPFITLYKAQ